MKIWIVLLLYSLSANAGPCPERWSAALKSGFTSSSNLSDQGEVLVNQLRNQTLRDAAEHQLPFKELVQTVDHLAERDPVFKKLNEMFEKRQFTFAVDQSADKRLDILKDGILNQHQTSTSGAVVSPEKRNFVESLYLRMDEASYRKLPNEVKPKSMYLVPELNSTIKGEPTHYLLDVTAKKRVGDTWILDLDQIEKNTVFVVGDSLDRALIEGDLLDDFKQFTLNYSAKLPGNHAIDHLLPLEWIKASAPFFYDQVKSVNRLRFVDPQVFKDYYAAQVKAHGVYPMWQEAFENTSRPVFDESFFKKFPELKKYDENLLVRPFGNYVEGLHFGKLPPKKIKAMIYHDQPPTAAELKEFKKLGIQVIDGRQK